MPQKAKGSKAGKTSIFSAITDDSLASFGQGAVVLLTLNNPREKFWGAMLALSSAGVSLRGIELSSFDDAANAVAGGETMTAAVLFFPMHRLERIELDTQEGNLPSLSQRFSSRTGIQPLQASNLPRGNRRSRA